ncbi:MAG: hypothetical protein IJH04_02390 [Eggerthellaceae bacterium]|nr:hypothetical protein [Eggerthellaceae bacterium]
MVGFGLDNRELGNQIAPFMFAMTDNLDHELRIVIGASVVVEPVGKADLEEWPQSMRENIEGSKKLQDMVSRMSDVRGSTDDVWEIEGED